MESSQKIIIGTKKISTTSKRKSVRFTPRPDRTLEWLGGVTYSIMERVLVQVKLHVRTSPREEIHLIVNSYGGASGIAMSFYDTMKWLRVRLVTIGSGDVDSSGVIIFLAGKKRFLTPNTTMLFHLAGRTFDSGKRFTTEEMRAMLQEDKLKDYQYACIVSDATLGRYTPDKILEMMSRNTIVTSEEAVRMGLAHRVLS